MATPRATRSSGRSRGARLGILLGIVALFTVGAAVLASQDNGPKPLPAAVDPVLPDLTMVPITEVEGGFRDDGTPIIRFPATIANIGAGDFEATAKRSWLGGDDWTVVQRVHERTGGFTERATAGTLVYAGDQHDHWHIAGMEAHRLEQVDTGTVVGEVLKQGFCPFDVEPYGNVPGAPSAAVYPETGCGKRFDTRLDIGISKGWADIYPWDMIQQQISVAGIADGRYRIHEIADPANLFAESDETNNETSVLVDVEVLAGIPKVTIVPPSS